ncbi:MAG: CDP-diacylglycerol--glycerol-3-phosphate 3-phosphatidyltransferase [Clostridiales bacterium]|nr:CDP-diacylglycerol--glycerol-3-phosphate 3-phosphatidyltransferase [Clostridiales bacterium]
MNLPNKLTVMRILLVFVILIISFLNIPGEVFGISLKFLIIEIIFIIASITDHYDGYLARKNNQITTFGKFLDPIADKILVVTTMLLLTERGTLPAWIPIITIFREFLVSGYRLVEAKEGGNVVAANIWGKIKTVTQMIAIILMLIDSNKFFAFTATKLPMPWMILNILGSIMMLISVIATIFSGYTYLRNGKDLFKDK